MGKLKGEERVRALKDLSDEVRRKDGVPWRSAIVGSERQEFIRGKDFARFFRQHPEKMAGLVDTEQSVDYQIMELAHLLLEVRMMIRCERFYKKPHPGRKHLVKWPRKLIPYAANGQQWDEDSFYFWTEERPTPAWQHAMSILVAVLILAACLFPLAPYWMRISVVYFFLALLGGIFGLVAFRLLLFAVVFVVSGYEFWLFPNLISDQVDFLGAFMPAVSFGKPADGRSHWASRLACMIGCSLLLYVLFMYSPHEKGLAMDVRKAHDSILDMFNLAANPSIASGIEGGSQQFQPPPMFGNDRTIDPEKIRQRMFQDRHTRVERARAQAEAAAAAAEQEESAEHGEDEPTEDEADRPTEL